MIETSKILKMHPGQLRFHKNTSYQRMNDRRDNGV